MFSLDLHELPSSAFPWLLAALLEACEQAPEPPPEWDNALLALFSYFPPGPGLVQAQALRRLAMEA